MCQVKVLQKFQFWGAASLLDINTVHTPNSPVPISFCMLSRRSALPKIYHATQNKSCHCLITQRKEASQCKYKCNLGVLFCFLSKAVKENSVQALTKNILSTPTSLSILHDRARAANSIYWQLTWHVNLWGKISGCISKFSLCQHLT